MSLIRRKRSPSPAERALGYARLGLKGLVAQRVARRAFKGYKLARKLPLVLGLGAIAFVVAKRAKGGSGSAAGAPAPAPTPPAAGSSPQTGTTPPPAAQPTSASKATEPVAVAEGNGAPSASSSSDEPSSSSSETESSAAISPDLEPEGPSGTPDLSAVLDTEATVPAVPSAAGTGGAEGEGVPTDEESAAESGESTDAAPPKD